MKRLKLLTFLFMLLVMPVFLACGHGDNWTDKSSNRGTIDDSPEDPTSEPLAALEFDLTESIGLVGVKSADLYTSDAFTVGEGHVMAAAVSSETPVKKVLINGTLADITNYTLPVQGYYISPSGDLYILLSTKLAYGDDTGVESECILFKVLTDSTYECIDSTGEYAYGGYSISTINNPAVQFDSSNNVYYKVREFGTALLRRNSSGVVNDLTNDNMSISNWLVAPDGTVFMSGYTVSNGSSWFRRLDSSGSLVNLIGTGAALNFMKFFPDGKIYFGDWGKLFGVGKTNVADISLSIPCLMGETINSAGSTWCDPNGGLLGADNRVSTLCTDNGLANTNADCGLNGYSGTGLSEYFVTENDEVYVIVSSGSSNRQLWKYYPAIEFIPTTVVPDIRKAIYMTGNKVAMYGLNATQNNKLMLYDLSTDTETDLLPSDEVEIYHLNVTSDGKIWFDGLRFSNNSFTIGYVDTANANAVTFLSTTTQQLLDFQTF